MRDTVAQRPFVPVRWHFSAFAAEIEKARQEGDALLRQSGCSHELAGVHCDDCGEAIRARTTGSRNLRACTVHHA